MDLNNVEGRNLYRECRELETHLRSLKKSYDDISVINIRENLKKKYEKILLNHYDIALKQDIESSLWKYVFYKVIEESRSQRNKFKNDKTKSKEEIKGRIDNLKKFLESSRLFYHSLIKQFQSKYNLDLEHPIPPEGDPLYRQYLTCHRCYIFLGDLARYHGAIERIDKKSLDEAASYYNRALKLWPDNGHPHNQLAVLCNLEENEFKTLYHYYRSLAVKKPFETAKENLMVLFKSSSSSSSDKSSSEKKSKNRLKNPELFEFLHEFVRIHGQLFLKQVSDLYPKMQDFLTKLEKMITNNIMSEKMIISMFIINVFSIYNLSGKLESSTSSYAEISQRTTYVNYAKYFILDCFLVVLQSFLNTRSNPNERGGGGGGGPPITIKSISLITSWLQHNSDILRSPESDTPNAELWSEVRQEILKLANYMIKSSDAKEVISMESNPQPLPEDIDINGYLPLKEVVFSVDFSLKVLEESEAYKKRVTRVIQFCRTLINVDWSKGEKYMVFNLEGYFSLTPTAATSSSSTTSLTSTTTRLSPTVPTKVGPMMSVNQENDLHLDNDDDDDDDDVGDEILFSPHTAKMAGVVGVVKGHSSSSSSNNNNNNISLTERTSMPTTLQQNHDYHRIQQNPLSVRDPVVTGKNHHHHHNHVGNLYGNGAAVGPFGNGGLSHITVGGVGAGGYPQPPSNNTFPTFNNYTSSAASLPSKYSLNTNDLPFDNIWTNSLFTTSSVFQGANGGGVGGGVGVGGGGGGPPPPGIDSRRMASYDNNNYRAVNRQITDEDYGLNDNDRLVNPEDDEVIPPPGLGFSSTGSSSGSSGSSSGSGGSKVTPPPIGHPFNNIDVRNGKTMQHVIEPINHVDPTHAFYHTHSRLSNRSDILNNNNIWTFGGLDPYIPLNQRKHMS
eukprot:TRINITY_DN538_c5_g1_i1.p1 TRINITY_DN538_c5_g1~~TRINITY_DN538_c5_g1_i1.p1  ORF type:complete len:899 (+),score=257.01 TRINITY_DN538_c5_g1_i1:35-2731(+)